MIHLLLPTLSLPNCLKSLWEGCEGVKGPKWKKMSSKELGIKISMIAKPTRSVLNELRKKGRFFPANLAVFSLPSCHLSV